MKPRSPLPHSAVPRCLAHAAALAALVLLALTSGSVAAQEKTSEAEQVSMAEMMAKARTYTEPGPKHELLKRFLGTWETEARLTMPGMDIPPEKGKATFSWLMDGRWLQQTGIGTMMGRPVRSFLILGYDNFKQSYRMMTVGTIDTALLVSEGDLTPDGKSLITYGTLDEYLTGEHDKMVKYVWRFLSDDEMLFEVHDLPIGETNTKVVEVRYRRAKDKGNG